jgi:hypothetical protein
MWNGVFSLSEGSFMTISRAFTVAAAATMLLRVLALAQDQEKKIERSDS